MNLQCKAIYLLAILAGLSACNDDAPDIGARTEGGKDQTLARVEGEPITSADVDRALIRMGGASTVPEAGLQARRNVLQSLVLSRAMALAAESELDVYSRQAIENRVAAFREQLLVKRYIRKNAAITPIAEEDIQRYYNDHPERFGGGTQTRYELIAPVRDLQPGEREQILAAFRNAARFDNWPAWVASLHEQGLPLAVKHGVLEKEPLPEAIKAELSTLIEGETSDVVLTEGRPYIARIIETRKSQPRPLGEVRTTIRRSLLPRQIKKAVESLTDPLLKQTQVEYLDPRYAPRHATKTAKTPETKGE